MGVSVRGRVMLRFSFRVSNMGKMRVRIRMKD